MDFQQQQHQSLQQQLQQQNQQHLGGYTDGGDRALSSKEQDKEMFYKCEHEIGKAWQELEYILEDLKYARERNESTGAIHSRIEKMEARIKELEKEKEKYRSSADVEPEKPNLTEREFIISGAVVGRKEPGRK